MDAIKTSEIAHALYRARGNQAELEAAQKERQHKAAGEEEQSATWRAIRGIIRQMRGANQR